MKVLKIAVIQMHIEQDKSKNIETAHNFIEKACKHDIDMAILPEMFCCPYKTSNFPIYAEYENKKSHKALSNLAKKFGIYLVAGSMPEKDENDNIFNTSYIFDPNGNQVGKHRKMHLFDIQIDGGQHFKESDTLTSGDNICVFDTKFGKLGLCICYDFRFPELSRMMVDNGAKAIIVPAAFNMTTGPAHWEIMFKSRAIDNQVYTIGCAPSRDYNSSYISYGNSIVVSPWGDVVERMDDSEGYFISSIDFDYVDKIRRELPLLSHRRLDIY